MSDTFPSLTLVLGGQRSGKSAHAEGLIGHDQEALYVATAQALDKEMGERVAAHKDRRGKNWTTVEEPLDLATALLTNDKAGRTILIDSLAIIDKLGTLNQIIAARADTVIFVTAGLPTHLKG